MDTLKKERAKSLDMTQGSPIRLGAGADPFGILSVPLVQPPRKRGRIRPRREKPPVPPGGAGGFCLVTVWKDYLWKLPWP